MRFWVENRELRGSGEHCPSTSLTVTLHVSFFKLKYGSNKKRLIA